MVEQLDVMSTNADGTLTEDQEILLNAYVDGEATSVERARAEVLVKTSEPARRYVDSLRALCRNISDSFQAEDAQHPADLWQRVNARIEQEDRTAVLLGERQLREITDQPIAQPKRSWFAALSEWLDPRVFVGGVSGATVTAALLLLVGNSANLLRPSSEVLTVKVPASVSGAQPLSALRSSTGLGLIPASRGVGNSNDLVRRGVEVEWARANGSMRFIQNPGARSATIWVKRRPPESAALPLSRPTGAVFNTNSERGN